MCGEKFSGELPRLRRRGSPPRVRGKAEARKAVQEAQRITPACAGKSNCLRYYRPGRKDHPRVCGEKQRLRRTSGSGTGSPPRVRGKVPVATPNPMPVRITPACAGKRLTKSHYCAIFVLPFSAVHSVYDRAQAPGNNLATPCGWTAAPEKSTRPGSQVYSLEHHPLRAEPDQADRGSG